MWISKGNLDLHHGAVKDYIYSLAERRNANKTLNKKVCTTFHYLLHNQIQMPISGYLMMEQLAVNPGKSRLFASWFKHEDTLPIVLCHIPKHPTSIFTNQVLIEFDNMKELLNEVEITTVDQDNKLTIVDPSWTKTPKEDYDKCWNENIAEKWGSIEWQILGNPFFEITTDINTHRTIINTSHELGLYESICYLSGISRYRNLGFHNIIYSTVKRT